MNIVELGQAFRSARIERRLTQQDAARHAGISVATISRLERGDLLELGVVKLISLFGLVGMDLIPRPKGHARTLDDIQRENVLAQSSLTTSGGPPLAQSRVRRTKSELETARQSLLLSKR